MKNFCREWDLIRYDLRACGYTFDSMNIFMAKICNSIFILVVIQEGKFVHVSNKYELETKVGSFYNFLTLEKSKANVQFSFPYVDFFGAGK